MPKPKTKQKLQWAFEKAQQNIGRDMVARKKYHDKAIHCHELVEGDLVLLRDKKPGSNYKIADKWVEGIYEVVSRKENGPVFRIRTLGGGGEQTIHRNMIHPARSIIRDDELKKEGMTALSKANILMNLMFET